MAIISDPHLLGFAESERGWATNMLLSYLEAKMLVALWNARGISLAFGNIEDTIADNTDDRPPATAGDMNLVITRMQEMIADLEANNSAKLNTLVKISYNNGWLAFQKEE